MSHGNVALTPVVVVVFYIISSLILSFFFNFLIIDFCVLCASLMNCRLSSPSPCSRSFNLYGIKYLQMYLSVIFRLFH